MRAFRHNRFAGGGSSIMKRDDLNPHKMRRKLAAFEARLSYEENRTLRAAILAMILCMSATIVVVAHILVS